MTENQRAAMATASPGRDYILMGRSEVFVDEGENNTIIKALGAHPFRLVYWLRTTRRCTPPAFDELRRPTEHNASVDKFLSFVFLNAHYSLSGCCALWLPDIDRYLQFYSSCSLCLAPFLSLCTSYQLYNICLFICLFSNAFSSDS